MLLLGEKSTIFQVALSPVMDRFHKANFGVEDGKMDVIFVVDICEDMNFSALEDLSGDIQIFGKTWTFSKRSVETGKLQHSVVSL